MSESERPRGTQGMCLELAAQDFAIVVNRLTRSTR